jgi:urease accessory protein
VNSSDRSSSLDPSSRDDAHMHPHAGHHRARRGQPSSGLTSRALRVGVAGPIGSGKTTLVVELVRALHSRVRSIAVITNDVFVASDAQLVLDSGVLPPERVIGLATGGCPHTAIRDDVSVNENAALSLEERWPDLELLLIESGGDNLTTTFSHDLVDRWLCVLDVAGGDDVPAKGGPALTRSDLLIINKTDLAPYVGASVERMVSDSQRLRGSRPVLSGSCRQGSMLETAAAQILEWMRVHVGAEADDEGTNLR